MCKRLPIDELREMVKQFKKDAENLYRYNDPGRSADLFNRLSTNDKKRLLYWILTQEDDKDVQAVANYFMKKLDEKINNLEQLSAQLYLQDKAEINSIGSQMWRKGPRDQSEQDKKRIDLVLSEACIELGSLEAEDAYWVLIPENPMEDAVWVSARGRQGEISSFVIWPDMVDYYPDKNELYKLYSAMRSASWVLHIHNHPNSLIPIASSQDRAFAKAWKTRRPELTGKMKFFVVNEDAAVEYTENEGFEQLWSILLP